MKKEQREMEENLQQLRTPSPNKDLNIVVRGAKRKQGIHSM